MKLWRVSGVIHENGDNGPKLGISKWFAVEGDALRWMQAQRWAVGPESPTLAHVEIPARRKDLVAWLNFNAR
jgi:hypothetical protein